MLRNDWPTATQRPATRLQPEPSGEVGFALVAVGQGQPLRRHPDLHRGHDPAGLLATALNTISRLPRETEGSCGWSIPTLPTIASCHGC
jgi:hypothetical protein